MPDYTALVSILDDSLLPRHVQTNTLHFQDVGALSDPQGLADDLAAVYQAFYAGAQISPQANTVNVKFYDKGDAIPRPIKGEKSLTLTPSGSAAAPRELAICLSFYSERNLPRQRGRIYLGHWAAAQVAERVPLALRTKLLDLADAIAGLGGADVDWQVYSRVDDQGRSVTDAWVNDDWDIVRSRQPDETVRSTRAVGA
jgi:hypothetical protein